MKAIARELGVDRKTIKRWRRRGAWRPRALRVYTKAIDAHRVFLERRGPEVGWNGVVLLRELRPQGFTGGYQQLQRALQPLRTTRQWAARATVRFETGPGEQAQVDFGQLPRVDRRRGDHGPSVRLYARLLAPGKQALTEQAIAILQSPSGRAPSWLTPVITRNSAGGLDVYPHSLYWGTRRMVEKLTRDSARMQQTVALFATMKAAAP